MWNIKEVKTQAKQVLKRNYFVLVFIFSVALFLGVIPGNGMDFATLSTTSVTGEETEAPEEEYTPGLVRYLDSIINGESKAKQLSIAKDVMESFNGLGGNVYGILRAVDRFFFANETAARLLIVVSFILYILFAYFVRNILFVNLCRIGIDAARPDYKVHFADFMTVFHSSGYMNAVKVMFLWIVCLDTNLLAGDALCIWGATIIANNGGNLGGALLILAGFLLVAVYFYRYMVWAMVPYILATNPSASAKECFALSKAMMDGNKWALVKLRLSYLGWDILSMFTFGLLDLLYIEPVVSMAYAGVYLKLREKAIEENREYVALLEPDQGKLYPAELRPNKLGQLIKDRNPERHYSLINLILLFFIFAFIGWSWEVLIHIVKDGVFVNRGTMHGPWLPIYGFGGAGIIAFLRRFAKKPALLVTGIFVGCGVLEYVAHWYLEVTKGTRWWDYSNYFLNLNGRICFEGLFVFCVAGVFAVYVIGPALDDILNRISDKKKWTIATILLAIFAADAVYSHSHPNVGKGITDYDKK